MSCYHPLIGIWKGKYTDSGKKKYEIEGNLSPEDCPSVYDHVMIPCGKCIGCRLDYSRSWADRMMLELETSGKGLFITLTYDNEHLPPAQFDEYDNLVFGTLNKRDCQLFLKRLRRRFEPRKIRFFLAGEYGSKTFRPHYHAILFGLGLDDIPDLVPHGTNEFGDRYYISDCLRETWSCGYILLSDVSWKTCAYVARYITKKLNGPLGIDYAIRNVIPEFSLMSRKPGIGKEYLELHPDCLDYQSINLMTPEGGLKLSIPKYYLKQLELTDPDRFAKIKEQRKEFAEDRMILKLQKTGLSYLDYLEVEENKKLECAKVLKRSKVE